MYYKRYTLEEDARISEAIKNRSGNIATTLEQLSVEMGRDFSSIKGRWYKHLSKKEISISTVPTKESSTAQDTPDILEAKPQPRMSIWNRFFRLFQKKG